MKIYKEQERIKCEVSNVEAQMQKEIDDCIQFNIDEMNKALDELKKSFEDEIQALDETLFADVIQGLKDDMSEELENLQILYEEQRRVEIEKIRNKYRK
jgi:hypothetical protein